MPCYQCLSVLYYGFQKPVSPKTCIQRPVFEGRTARKPGKWEGLEYGNPKPIQCVIGWKAINISQGNNLSVHLRNGDSLNLGGADFLRSFGIYVSYFRYVRILSSVSTYLTDAFFGASFTAKMLPVLSSSCVYSKYLTIKSSQFYERKIPQK